MKITSTGKIKGQGGGLACSAKHDHEHYVSIGRKGGRPRAKTYDEIVAAENENKRSLFQLNKAPTSTFLSNGSAAAI